MKSTPNESLRGLYAFPDQVWGKFLLRFVTSHLALNPDSLISLSTGRKLPLKPGELHLELMTTSVVLPIGVKLNPSEPESLKLSENESFLSLIVRSAGKLIPVLKRSVSFSPGVAS